MTRNILLLATSLGLLLGLGSCKDYLNTSPSNSELTENTISDYNLLDATTLGMYDGLQGKTSQTAYYAANFLLAADVMGDNIQSTTSGSRGTAYYLMNFDATTNLGCWSIAYDCVRRANRLLQMCDNLDASLSASSLDTQEKTKRQNKVKRSRAEALATRALAFFDLLRQYATPYPYSNNGSAPGIPLVLSPSDSEAIPGRATVGEVYKQITADLQQAIDLGQLPETAYGRFSSSAVKALLARVYLYMGTTEGNQKALALSKEVIDGQHYKLATTADEYKEVWSEPRSREMIFCLSNFDSHDWADREGLAYIYHVNGYRNAHLTKKFYTELMTDPDDLRWSVLWASRDTWAADYSVGLDGVTEDTKIWIGKYPGKAAYGDMRTNDVPVIRLAEVYLNAAEAAFKLGDTSSALTYLNVIVQRANPAKSVAASDLTLERILTERGKELFGEGHRFFDLMRTGQRCERFINSDPQWHGSLEGRAQSFDHTFFRTVLPIPQAELDANPTLRSQQNPGY